MSMVPEVDLPQAVRHGGEHHPYGFFRGHSGVLQDPFPGHPDGAVAVEADAVGQLGIQVFCPEDKAGDAGVFGDKVFQHIGPKPVRRGIFTGPLVKVDVLLHLAQAFRSFSGSRKGRI